MIELKTTKILEKPISNINTGKREKEFEREKEKEKEYVSNWKTFLPSELFAAFHLPTIKLLNI